MDRKVAWREIESFWYTAEVRLRGMPKKLMDRAEEDIGKSIEIRWRWKGLAKPKTVQSTPGKYGFSSSTTWLIPSKLRLDLLENGKLLWSLK